jgi:hypothetical protein
MPSGCNVCNSRIQKLSFFCLWFSFQRGLWNVVYLLDCHVCGSQYVGKSVQPFNKRMNGHRSDLTKKTLLPVSQHFVSPVHSLNMNRMRKCNDEVYQLAKDQALIKKLKNKRFRPFCLWLPGVMFVTCRSKNALFSVNT